MLLCRPSCKAIVMHALRLVAVADNIAHCVAWSSLCFRSLKSRLYSFLHPLSGCGFGLFSSEWPIKWIPPFRCILILRKRGRAVKEAADACTVLTILTVPIAFLAKSEKPHTVCILGRFGASSMYPKIAPYVPKDCTLCTQTLHPLYPKIAPPIRRSPRRFSYGRLSIPYNL